MGRDKLSMRSVVSHIGEVARIEVEPEEGKQPTAISEHPFTSAEGGA